MKYSKEFKKWHAPGMVSLIKMHVIDQLDDATREKWGLVRYDQDSVIDYEAPQFSLFVANTHYSGRVLITYNWDSDNYCLSLPEIGKTEIVEKGILLRLAIEHLMFSSQKAMTPQHSERMLYFSMFQSTGKFFVKQF